MKIGIMGGSYNPIHIGHAIIANYIIQNTCLDKLWLMVSPENPFKSGQKMASDMDRIRMTEMVASRLDNVVTSAFEFSLPRPSYTIDTLNALQSKFPDDEFYLIIGADNWAAFERWRNHQEIIENFHIFVYPRRGYDVVIPQDVANKVELVDAPFIEVSSTKIREQLGEYKNMCFYLPEDVYEYIVKKHLYMD
ncbi:MAG: nicotinate-nucleotide adenylyltransferase [Bacteroidales bacterium]|nr:nicotinate-nucleotide adenylyltransferase [Candidatus Sodaliphilus fimicaballi]